MHWLPRFALYAGAALSAGCGSYYSRETHLLAEPDGGWVIAKRESEPVLGRNQTIVEYRCGNAVIQYGGTQLFFSRAAEALLGVPLLPGAGPSSQTPRQEPIRLTLRAPALTACRESDLELVDANGGVYKPSSSATLAHGGRLHCRYYFQQAAFLSELARIRLSQDVLACPVPDLRVRKETSYHYNVVPW